MTLSRVAGVETGIIVFCVAALALSAVSLVHLMRAGPEAFARAQVNRGAWSGLLVFGVAMPLPGVVFPIAYLTAIRARLTSR